MRAAADFAFFQFHKGTIKARVLHRCHNNRRCFQFHKGTIKASTTSTQKITRNYLSIP